jgi:integrase
MTHRNRQAEQQIVPVAEWPEADRLAWKDACQPSIRLKKGGSGSHLGSESLSDYASRYGRYLGFLKRTGHLDVSTPAASLVTLTNVEAYVADFDGKIGSVTAWNCIYKLRRAAQLLSPKTDFVWLIEIERDLDAVQEPRSKLNRFVYTEQLIKAGLTLIVDAKDHAHAQFKRAQGIRNGLMLALLALNPVRLKNFAALEIGTTFKQIEGQWWISIAARSTKSKQRPEERPVATWLNPYIELYLNEARPILRTGSKDKETKALWISSVTRRSITKRKLGSLITQITRETLGIDISPHLFRTADATTAADAQSDMPYLACALLGHSNARITDEHYKRNSSLNVQSDFAQIIQRKYLRP